MEQQDEDVVAALLVGGANPNQPNKDVTSLLHAAAQRGPLSLLSLLLQHKADVHAANGSGWTPLHLAARAGSAPKVAALLAAGASHAAANSQGNTPLHLVRRHFPGAALCCVRAVTVLSLHAPDACSAAGCLLVVCCSNHVQASVNGHAKVVEALLAAGADASLKNGDGRTPRAMAKNPQVEALFGPAA